MATCAKCGTEYDYGKHGRTWPHNPTECRDALAAQLAEERRKVEAAYSRGVEAMREAAVAECEREARACENHARSFKLTGGGSRMPVHRAHEMAANQSRACGAYIKALALLGRGAKEDV